MKTVLIIAGGTGGHIFPALAVADQLAAQQVSVQWLGSRNRLEQKLVDGRYPIHYVSTGAVRGKGLLTKLLSPLRLLMATWQAWRYIRRIKPNAVLAMGGFVSGPGGLAAKLAGVPLVVHEQNTLPGLTNRYLAKLANKVLQAFPKAFPDKIQAVTIGNPVRSAICELPEPEQRWSQDENCRLLVLGGSQGAHAVNQLVTKATGLLNNKASIAVWHQTGRNDEAEVRAAYQQQGIAATVTAFIDDMAEAYAWADIAICRAGALTVSELAAAGLGALFIPFPYAVDDHQYHNAKWLVAHGAAELYRQTQITPTLLRDKMTAWCANRATLLSMANRARAAFISGARERIIEEVTHAAR